MRGWAGPAFQIASADSWFAVLYFLPGESRRNEVKEKRTWFWFLCRRFNTEPAGPAKRQTTGHGLHIDCSRKLSTEIETHSNRHMTTEIQRSQARSC